MESMAVRSYSHLGHWLRVDCTVSMQSCRTRPARCDD